SRVSANKKTRRLSNKRMSKLNRLSLNPEDRDQFVLNLLDQLVEIEQRLIPTGLHIFGRVSTAQQKIDLLRMIVSFDRPESGAMTLPDLISEALVSGDSANDEKPLEERSDALVTKALELFLEQGSDVAIQCLGKAGIQSEQLRPLFALLENVVTHLD